MDTLDIHADLQDPREQAPATVDRVSHTNKGELVAEGFTKKL